jgi:two-component system sensor histidine kinase PilS (NtrC family)
VVVVRLIGLVSFLVAYFLLRIFLTEPQPSVILAPAPARLDGLVYSLLIFAIALNLGFLVRLHGRRVALRRLAWLQFGSDLVLTTTLVYFFGGAASPFSSIFFVVIILTTTFLGRRAGLTIAGAAWVLYSLAALARHYAWLSGADAASDPISEVAYRLLLHLLGFVLVAVLASRLVRELSRAESDLARLRVVHRDIVESIPSGLMTFDPEGIVTRRCTRWGSRARTAACACRSASRG